LGCRVDKTVNKPEHKTVQCPVCGNAVLAIAHKPFCSERCTNVDLHRWLTGGYAVPMEDSTDDDELSKESE
jgi:uncharacterized protein